MVSSGFHGVDGFVEWREWGVGWGGADRRVEWDGVVVRVRMDEERKGSGGGIKLGWDGCGGAVGWRLGWGGSMKRDGVGMERSVATGFQLVSIK